MHQASSAKVGFVSLGCPKATVDSEQILTQLRAEGYEISGSYDSANLVIVNTCGFIDDAVKESLDTIGEALEENGKVIVTGCLGARAEVVRDVHPDVLAVTGPQALDEVMTAVRSYLPAPDHDPFTSLIPAGGIKLTPRHYAYLKIAEGCNHKCTFCIIPSMRGRLVSRPVGDVIREAQALVSAGVRELLVISQDTSAYGVDVRYRTEFHNAMPVKTSMYDLARVLGGLGVWVRLHYVYPYPHVDQILPLMADKKILPYLDVPFQHASPQVLKNMKRPACAENNLNRINAWREICPDLTIRSTFIVGFPGETEADFECLLEFLTKAQLDRVGCFAYSAVEGARANSLPGSVDEQVKQQRLERFMLHQAQISEQKLKAKIGKTLPVMIDQIDNNRIIARGEGDAPEVDGLVYIDTEVDNVSLKPGDIISAKIIDATQHDLIAEMII